MCHGQHGLREGGGREGEGPWGTDHTLQRPVGKALCARRRAEIFGPAHHPAGEGEGGASEGGGGAGGGAWRGEDSQGLAGSVSPVEAGCRMEGHSGHAVSSWAGGERGKNPASSGATGRRGRGCDGYAATTGASGRHGTNPAFAGACRGRDGCTVSTGAGRGCGTSSAGTRRGRDRNAASAGDGGGSPSLLPCAVLAEKVEVTLYTQGGEVFGHGCWGGGGGGRHTQPRAHTEQGWGCGRGVTHRRESGRAHTQTRAWRGGGGGR